MKPTSIATVIIFLLLSVATVSAQTCASGEEPSTNKLNSIELEGRKFNLFAIYCVKEITAGRSVPVTIKIDTELIPGSPSLEIKGLPTLGREDANRITFSTADPESDDKPRVSVRKYNYEVKISEGAEPRKYAVQLHLGFPDNHPVKKIVDRDFQLPVGVNSNGKLEVSEESQLVSYEGSMFSTANYKYKLKLRNLFRDYTAYVESISVSSEPDGWIFPITEIPLKVEERFIAPTGERTIIFDFNTAPLSGNLIRGFSGTPPKLKFDIVYNDGFQRQLFYDQGRQPMAISPSIGVLVGAVLLGLLFGAIVRGVLEFMYFKKRFTSPAVVRIVTYSLLFGFLVVLLTLAGQIEIKSKTFSLSSSYDNPLVMLMIGLISALAGLQMFTGWYKSLQSE